MLTTHELIQSDPREYFAFPPCPYCRARPCNKLRYGTYRPGECLFVHRSDYSTQHPCPFAAKSFHEIDYMLRGLVLRNLDWKVRNLMGFLTPMETMRFNHEHYIDGYLDWAGRINYLRALWEARLFAAIRIPPPLDQDERMTAWIYAWDNVVLDIPKEEKKQAEEQPEEAVHPAAVSLTNPRWEHSDAGRKNESPDKAASADKVLLKVDTTGLDEGALVTFTIYDCSSGSSKRVDALNGRNSGGTASVEWTVTKKAGPSPKLEFDGTAGGKTSGRAKINLLVKMKLVFSA